MTTITIKKDVESLPREFEDWDELQDFVLNKLRVHVKPIPEEEISPELLNRVNESRIRYNASPDSYDNI